MKLYMHPVSTTCRPIRLLIAENGIKCDEETVDIVTGAHYQEPYVSLNPNRLVPMLVDDDFRLTEASAILKYLAEKYRAGLLSEGPETTRQGQRNDGLAEHPILSGLWLWAGLPPALSTS